MKLSTKHTLRVPSGNIEIDTVIDIDIEIGTDT